MKTTKLQPKVKKGDTVTLLAGKDRGKTGKVLTVDKEGGRITVEGLNLLIKHVKSRQQSSLLFCVFEYNRQF